MKTNLFFIIVIAVATLSFISVQSNDNKKLAIVNSYNGVDVYVDCKPTLDYEVLGEVKQFTWTHWEDCREKLIAKAKASYSKTDGIIILQLSATKTAKAEAIHYKVK